MSNKDPQKICLPNDPETEKYIRELMNSECEACARLVEGMESDVQLAKAWRSTKLGICKAIAAVIRTRKVTNADSV